MSGGARLAIRIGLHVGEARVRSDYFGTPVVIARRLCERAGRTGAAVDFAGLRDLCQSFAQCTAIFHALSSRDRSDVSQVSITFYGHRGFSAMSANNINGRVGAMRSAYWWPTARIGG